MRATWKGQLRLSLVSIPVEVYPATKRGAHVSFRQIHGPSGRPVRHEKVVPGLGPIDKEDILKGYEVEKGEYVLLEPEEIEAVRLESKRTFELVQFVEACEIPPIYFDRPHYVVPSDPLAEDAYRVVREALRRTSRVGLGQITMRGQEHLAAVKPCGNGLLLETLHYADELREAEPLFAEIEGEDVDDDLLSVAEKLIERKAAPFDAGAFEDHYATALEALIAEKLHGKSSRRVSIGDAGSSQGSSEGAEIIDLMEALKKSLASTAPKGRGGSKKKAATKKRAGKASARKGSSGKRSKRKSA